ncbi:MAG: sulfite exporter TauE/SafE family protein [Rhodospirillales bacterium]|nr:sulfite exporter TauE/SafE family protein [Rhodospirillales bacterium]
MAFSVSDWVLLVFSLLALGGLAGFLAGLLGIGGGIVLVPGLLLIFSTLGFGSESLIHVCVGTSLSLIIPNGLMSSRVHWRKGAVDFGLVRRIGGGILVGVLIGTVIADRLAGVQLQTVFAVVIAALAALMVVNPARFYSFKSLPRWPWTETISAVIGALSSLIGIGGATMSVPFMSLCGVELRRAIGTAAALGVLIALPGTIGFMVIGLDETGRPPFSVGYVNLLAWVMILPSSLLAVRAGVWAAHALPLEVMRRVFAGFLVLVAIKMGLGL